MENTDQKSSLKHKFFHYKMVFWVQMNRDGLVDVELIGLDMTIRCRTRNFTSFNTVNAAAC